MAKFNLKDEFQWYEGFSIALSASPRAELEAVMSTW
jgi:hypothetical protein